jgi:hypothetical protein
MNITRLNQDVLSLLSALIAPSDVNSWRLVCRTLGHAAHPYRFCRLTLRDPSQLRDACASVAKTPGCAKHILYLAMGNGCFGSPDEPVDDHVRGALTPHIADLLYATTNLVSFAMDAAETFLVDNLALVAAMAACSRLETLVLEQRRRLGFLSHGTVALFAALRAPLRSLELSRLDSDHFPVHVLALLQHAAPTLETLTLDMVEIGPWREDSPAPVFPYVTELVMRIASVHTQTLEAAFPALRELSIEFMDLFSNQLLPVYQNAPSHWNSRHLASLSGDIGGLYTLGLRDVEVDLLSIHRHARDKYERQARREVLRGVRPHILHVWVCADIEGKDMLAHDLPECATSLRILDFNVTYRRVRQSERILFDAEATLSFLVRISAFVRPAPNLLGLTLQQG